MRPGRTTLFAGLAALGLVWAPTAGASDLKVSRGADVQFPTRALVLTLPVGTALTPSQVRVTENGKPVPNLTVTSSTATTSKHFGVVLAIDASPRMRRSIDGALAAARAFAAHRNPHHPLAALAFNHATRSLVGLTYSRERIDEALSQPPQLDTGRHLYDAVSGAIALLRRSHGINGSIVVISDGADKDSKLTDSDVIAQARAAGIRVYTVGIPDAPGFDSSSLEKLASGTNGEFFSAPVGDELNRTLDKLGTRIASEYLLSYRSLAVPHRHVDVKVSVEGLGSASYAYTSPALRHYPGSAINTHSFTRSTAAMVLVALLCAALVGLALALVLRPDPENVRSRMAQFVSGPVDGVDQVEASTKKAGPVRIPKPKDPLAERDWWMTLDRDLGIARIAMTPGHVVAFAVVGTVLGFIFLLAVTGSLALALLAAFVPFGVRTAIQHRVHQQRNLFADQLADALQVVASAIRVGQSFGGALAVAVEESPEPTHSELERVLIDEQLGVPLETALLKGAERMKSPDLAQLALVATVQRETGGNTAEVIDRVTDSIRARGELRGLVDTLTAQGRLTRWILTALPVAVFLVMLVINPDYLDPLLNTSAGHALIAVAVALVISGSLVIKRMVEIDV